EVDGGRIAGDKSGKHVGSAERKGGTCVAILHLLGGGGTRLAFFSGDNKCRLSAIRSDSIERGYERGKPCPLRRGDVSRRDAVRKLQRGSDNSCVLAVVKWHCCRGEVDGVDKSAVLDRVRSGQTVAPRLDRHG